MKITIREMTMVAIFAGLSALGAFISIPLGEVPITMQTAFVLLSGLILGPRLGALSQIVYLMLGLAGLPIFANFTGGLQALAKPSFGFLIGFVFAAYVAGWIAHSSSKLQAHRIWLASLLATGTSYLFGLPYMYYILNVSLAKGLDIKTIMRIGCLIFLPGDLIKLSISSLLALKILAILNKSHIKTW